MLAVIVSLSVLFFLLHVCLLTWMRNQMAWQTRQDEEIMRIYSHLRSIVEIRKAALEDELGRTS